MTTVIRRPVIKRCPFKAETDAGELVITFPGAAPELHELGARVEELAAKPVSHEDFTAAMAALLPEGVTVMTRWHTGPWDVEVSEGGAVLRQPDSRGE